MACSETGSERRADRATTGPKTAFAGSVHLTEFFTCSLHRLQSPTLWPRSFPSAVAIFKPATVVGVAHAGPPARSPPVAEHVLAPCLKMLLLMIGGSEVQAWPSNGLTRGPAPTGVTAEGGRTATARGGRQAGAAAATEPAQHQQSFRRPPPQAGQSWVVICPLRQRSAANSVQQLWRLPSISRHPGDFHLSQVSAEESSLMYTEAGCSLGRQATSRCSAIGNLMSQHSPCLCFVHIWHYGALHNHIGLSSHAQSE